MVRIGVRRGRLLAALRETDRELDATARALGTDRDGPLGQFDAVGLSGAVRRDVMEAWRRCGR